MPAPTFSIVIPSFNRAHLLPRAIASIQNQTYSDYEIVVVDDCSTDETKSLLNSPEYRKVRYITHSKNQGAAKARNTGIKAAKGQYVCFLDSDDVWLPKKIEEQNKLIEDSKAEVLGCQSIKLDEFNQKTTSQFHPLNIQTNSASLLSNLHINTSGICVKKLLLENVGGFDTQLTNYEDWDLMLSLASQTTKIAITKEMLVISYTHAANTSANTPKSTKYQNGLILYKKHSKVYDRHPTAKQELFYELGCTAREAKNYAEAASLLIKAWQSNPLSILGMKVIVRILQLLPHKVLQ